MSALWTAAEVAAATGVASAGAWTATGVSIDTRTLAPGDLFIALAGPNHDGHAFVETALGQGAAAAVVDRAMPQVDASRLVVVADTLAALTALGRAGRTRATGRISAVTGSVGKTGSKEALRHVLSSIGPTHASSASHNNHWGVPLSLARMPRAAAFGVFEVGMNRPGEIRALTGLVRPHAALITAIAPAHIGFFGSIEAIADAKGEIFEGLEPGGTAILNRDDPCFHQLRRLAAAADARVLTFGRHRSADIRIVAADLGPDGSSVDVVVEERRITFALGLPGRHWVSNGSGVLATAMALGADLDRAAAALAGVSPMKGRGARVTIQVRGGTATLVDDSYNANPTSVAAALDSLGRAPGRRVAVLGDMLELGEAAPALHAGLAGAVEDAGVALVFTAGPLMAHLHDALEAGRRGAHAPDSAALLPHLQAALRAGDTVLVKGSLGSRMGLIVDALTAPAGGRADAAVPRMAAG